MSAPAFTRMRWLGLGAAVLLTLTPTVTAAQNTATPFQVGDRILLSVEGDSALSDTFTVVAGPALRLPNIGDISLSDVPRAQLQPYLARELGRYIHDAVVTARALIRISVVGQVAKPGFYAVPVDLVLPDALMVAGGATQDARLEKLQIVRGTAPVWRSNGLQAAIARGATLEELGVRTGDRIEVPRGISDPESKWRIAGIIVGSLATAVGVIALTHR